MANALKNRPISIDTDIASYRTSASALQGIRVTKMILVVGPGGASSAGNVTITAPSDSAALYPPIVVPAGQAAGSAIWTDDPTEVTGALTWRDFAVTGVTATGTVLYLWSEV